MPELSRDSDEPAPNIDSIQWEEDATGSCPGGVGDELPGGK